MNLLICSVAGAQVSAWCNAFYYGSWMCSKMTAKLWNSYNWLSFMLSYLANGNLHIAEETANMDSDMPQGPMLMLRLFRMFYMTECWVWNGPQTTQCRICLDKTRTLTRKSCSLCLGRGEVLKLDDTLIRKSHHVSTPWSSSWSSALGTGDEACVH